MSAMTEDEMLHVFNAFDKNGDGTLEISELLHFIKDLKGKDKMDVEKILKNWDTDGNKQVSLDEFKTRMTVYVSKNPNAKDILQSAALKQYMNKHIGGAPSKAAAAVVQAAPPPALSLKRICAFFGKAGARDKFGRVAQFSARMYMGVLADSGDKEMLGKITTMHNTLRDARSTLRWLKWMDMISPIMAAKEISLALLSKIALFCFFLSDNMRWLQKCKLIPGEVGFKEWHPLRGSGKWTFSFLALGSFFGMLNALQQLAKLSEDKKEGLEAAKEKDTKRYNNIKAAFVSALMTYQGLHLSQLYVSDNKWVGLAGTISSSIQSYDIWKSTKV